MNQYEKKLIVYEDNIKGNKSQKLSAHTPISELPNYRKRRMVEV